MGDVAVGDGSCWWHWVHAVEGSAYRPRRGYWEARVSVDRMWRIIGDDVDIELTTDVANMSSPRREVFYTPAALRAALDALAEEVSRG